MSAQSAMTADEYRVALASLGLSQESLAIAVGASPRTGQKWALGETRVPGAVAVILRLLLARPELVSVAFTGDPPPVRARAAKRVKSRGPRKTAA